MLRRFSQIGFSLVLSVLLLAVPALAAGLDQEVELDIPAQSLEFALLKLSEQSGVQIQMASSDVPELQVAALSGRMPVSRALAALLNRTGLSYQIVGESTVAIYRDRGAGTTRKLRTDTLMASNAPAALPASPSTAREGAMALEEVVVTAQKREEKMQDVPISITAFSGEQIENRGMNSLADLNALAPNVMFRQSPGARLISVVSIRGSAMGQPAIWVDPPVGLYLNGIYLGKSQGSVFDIVDIERVEVLRGPQGTLFGRNTEGGAINFITRKPSGELSGKVGVEFGNFDHKVAKFNVDLPRFGIASVSLGARKEERDGWAKNLAGPDLGAIDSEAARASVKLDFSDDFNAIYDFDYSNIDNTPVPVTLYALDGWRGTFPSIFGAAFGTAIQNALAPYVTTKRPETVTVSGPGPLFERGKTDAHALTLTWQASDQDELKYVFARRSLFFTSSNDQDSSPVDLVTLAPGVSRSIVAYNNRVTDYEQDSHELQWGGNRGRLQHVLGLYYFKDDGETSGNQDFALFGAPQQRADYASGTRAWALFG